MILVSRNMIRYLQSNTVMRQTRMLKNSRPLSRVFGKNSALAFLLAPFADVDIFYGDTMVHTCAK